MNIKRYKEKMERVQRKMLLRVTSSYRTAYTKALQVITGIVPIELQVEERRNVQKVQSEHDHGNPYKENCRKSEQGNRKPEHIIAIY